MPDADRGVRVSRATDGPIDEDGNLLKPISDRGDAGRGVRVVRFPDTETGRFMAYSTVAADEGERGLGVVYRDDPRPNVIEVGVWYPKAIALAQMSVVEAAIAYLEWDGNRKEPNREGILLDTRKLIDTRAALVAARDALDQAQRKANDG